MSFVTHASIHRCHQVTHAPLSPLLWLCPTLLCRCPGIGVSDQIYSYWTMSSTRSLWQRHLRRRHQHPPPSKQRIHSLMLNTVKMFLRGRTYLIRRTSNRQDVSMSEMPTAFRLLVSRRAEVEHLSLLARRWHSSIMTVSVASQRL